MLKNFYFICLLSLLFLSGCAERTFKKSAFLLGTEVEITISEKNAKKAKRVIELALKKIRDEEKNLSYHLSSSEVARINQNAGKGWVEVSPELFSLIKISLAYSRLTDGAFDIAFSCGGYKKIILDEKRERIKFARKGMTLDLGGIAKGYIVDETVKLLQKEGIKEGLVNAGGDIRVFGQKSYRIAIRNPFKPVGVRFIEPETTGVINVAPTISRASSATTIGNADIIKVITVQNKAVCTSGIYERPDHIRNPRTGKSISNSLRSVTVIAPDTITADALATAVMVMGREKGEKLLQKLNFSYFLIDAEGKVTTNLSNYTN